MIDSVLQIRWDLMKEGDLDAFHDMLVDIHDREYTHENMIQILKHTPKYLVIEAILWGFDTCSRDKLYEMLNAPVYKGIIEDPNFVSTSK